MSAGATDIIIVLDKRIAAIEQLLARFKAARHALAGEPATAETIRTLTPAPKPEPRLAPKKRGYGADNRAAIREALIDAGGPVTPSYVQDVTGLSELITRKYLKEAVSDSFAIRSGPDRGLGVTYQAIETLPPDDGEDAQIPA